VVRRPDASALILVACITITCQRAAKEMPRSCVIHNFARISLCLCTQTAMAFLTVCSVALTCISAGIRWWHGGGSVVKPWYQDLIEQFGMFGENSCSFE
ncbi:Os01g0146101, partial [Oryza sativa Japonica Group]